METKQHRSSISREVLSGLGFLFILTAPLRAQYTANYQTNIISGVASNWTGNYLVGSNTFADALLIQNSGVLSNGYGYLGSLGGSSNNVASVTGMGSVWSNRYNLIVGGDGVGNSLIISNGGQVVDGYGYVGFHYGSNSVLVTGAGSVWNNGTFVYVGNTGSDNSLVISNGGLVVNGYGVVGQNPGADRNTVVVTGGGSVWSNRYDLTVGSMGAGNRMVVSDGGCVFNQNAYQSSPGYYSKSSSNSVLVTGSNSLWNNSGSLTIGNFGTGSSLVISNNGQVIDSNAYVGGSSGSSSDNNNALVAGPGSVWSSSTALYVGRSGSGNNLVINSGGVVVDTYGYVGYGYGGRGNAVLVSDTGSVWSNSSSVKVGEYGTDASLVVSNGGRVVTSYTYMAGTSYSSNNTVRVVDGGIVQSAELRIGDLGSSNSLVVLGGCVFATNLTVGFASANCDNLVQLDSGSVIVTNATGNATLEVRRGSFVQNGGTLQVDRFVITNACAQFIRTGGTLIYGVAVLDPNRDDDGDGIPNGWEQAHGLDPLNAADATLDNDGDGFSNLQEYQAGTDPTNSASAFRITGVAREGDDVSVTWTMGAGKTNALQAFAGDGGYSTNAFADIFAVSNTVGNVTNFLDVGGATNTPARFYRVRLVP